MKDADMKYEDHLLVASGILAILLTAAINGYQNNFWPSAGLYLLFLLGFLAIAYRDSLNISEQQQRILFFAQSGISILCWWLAEEEIILILTVVLMAQAPYLFSRRGCWHILLVINGIFIILFTVFTPQQEVFLTWLSLFALQAFALTSSLSRHREFLLREQLANQNAELIAARAALAQKSQAEERLRIAGDLHDGIGHQLTALRLQLEAIAYQAPEALKASIRESQNLSEGLLESIRSIVKRLANENSLDLPGTIEQLDKATPGVSISLSSTLPQYSNELATQLEFCLKEGVNNAIRHGNANVIKISATENSFSIEDNGTLKQPAQQFGFGLTNLLSRLQPFNGSVELQPLTPVGCRLAIEFESGVKP